MMRQEMHLHRQVKAGGLVPGGLHCRIRQVAVLDGARLQEWLAGRIHRVNSKRDDAPLVALDDLAHPARCARVDGVE
jgi:hypothetical protein